MGQLLLFWLHKKEGRMDTITNTGAEGLLFDTSSWIGTPCGTANSHRAWGSFMVCRVGLSGIGRMLDVPTGRACKQTPLP